MSKSSRIFLDIQEAEFQGLNPLVREKFNVIRVEPDDYDELFLNDEVYQGLHKTYRKASKELHDYKYNKRHKSNDDN